VLGGTSSASHAGMLLGLRGVEGRTSENGRWTFTQEAVHRGYEPPWGSSRFCSSRAHLELTYGYGVLDRFDLKGGTHFFGTRFQFQL
jgi:hypothetical protein